MPNLVASLDLSQWLQVGEVIAGALAFGVALGAGILAWRSAKDAKASAVAAEVAAETSQRTADAAEQTAEAAREEVEVSQRAFAAVRVGQLEREYATYLEIDGRLQRTSGPLENLARTDPDRGGSAISHWRGMVSDELYEITKTIGLVGVDRHLPKCAGLITSDATIRQQLTTHDGRRDLETRIGEARDEVLARVASVAQQLDDQRTAAEGK